MGFHQEACIAPCLFEKTKAVLGLNVEPSPSCLPVFLVSFLPGPSSQAASSPPCFVLQRKETDCLCRWGQRCFLSPESDPICLLFSTKPCFLEANLRDRNPNSARGVCVKSSGQLRETPCITQIEPVSQKWLRAGFYLGATLSISLPAFPCSQDTLSL